MPLDTVNDIRSMDAAGSPRSEIARVLHVSRNTVAKYADMEDMSPVAPMPQRRGRPVLEGNEEWIAGVLEADHGAPRKKRCVWQRFSRHFGCPVPTIWQKNRRCLRFLPSRASRPCPSSCSCR